MSIDEMKDRIARAEEIQRYTENRCEVLEKENADLKEEINKIAFARGTLEEENAELKTDNDARKFAMAMSEKVEKKLRQKNEKATELLKEFVEWFRRSDKEIKLDDAIITKAEQFISEVEK